MELKYRVHNSAIAPRQVAVEYNGIQVQATVRSVEVELVPEGHAGSSVTIRIDGGDDVLEAALVAYTMDSIVTMVATVATKTVEG